jgi:glyoxylase I family protein
MEISCFLHAALRISDLEQSDYFYGTLLGLARVERELKFPGIWYQIGTFQLHLIAEPKIINDGVDAEKWGRNRHLAFAVSDLEAMKTRFRATGYPFQSSASGRAALFVKDPDGNIIELNQL